MKRAQSLELLLDSGQDSKISALQTKDESDRPSPSSVTAISSLFLRPPAAEIRNFHHHFLSTLKEIVLASLYRTEVAKLMDKARIIPPLTVPSFPLHRMDFTNLISTINTKMSAYQSVLNPHSPQQQEINFLRFLYNLESKKLWTELLSLDYSIRVQKYTELCQTEPIKRRSPREKNKLKKFCYELAGHSEENRKIYRQMLISDESRLKGIIDALQAPERAHQAMMAKIAQLDAEKVRLSSELLGLFHKLKAQDDFYADKLRTLFRNLFALSQAYPRVTEFDDSWVDVGRQLFDSIHHLLHSSKLVDLLVIEASLRTRLDLVTIKTPDEGEDFDYFVDFDAPATRDECFMKVKSEIGSGFFHGEFSQLMALNYVLGTIYENEGAIMVYSVQ